MKSSFESPPRRVLPSVLEKIKSTYIVWHGYYNTLPKTQKYTLGNKVDNLFTDLIETVSTAIFLKQADKLPFLRQAIRKLDTLNIFIMILWETQSLDEKKYITLSLSLNEIGKMLGGWYGKLDKENSPS